MWHLLLPMISSYNNTPFAIFPMQAMFPEYFFSQINLIATAGV